ncbi:MAG: tRNA threonylcarbamoyladenosine dehydratase [Christensenellaceae bacterium]|jgi:tRNA A37 threonylcarbamoyladenosine dehydratase
MGELESMDASRTVALIGEDGLERLQNAAVAVFGIGGVGSYAAEALARSGIGTLVLVDKDVVKPSNINRQLVALNSTVGRSKASVMKERILDINERATVIAHEMFYTRELNDMLLGGGVDYVVDAIDSIDSKVDLIASCHERGIPIVSCMGAGNKLHPECFDVMDIHKTSHDPVAKIVRKRLRDKGIKRLDVVCSREEPVDAHIVEDGQRCPASISFVPSAAGLIAAGVAIRNLINKE